MSLPKLTQVTFSTKLPSTGKTVKFRPFVVKEEKALLIANESADPEVIIDTIKNVLGACVDNVDVENLPYFDIEHLFLQIRGKSIGENLKFSYRHANGLNSKGEKCDTITEVELDLDTVSVQKTKGHTTKVMIDSTYGVVLKYPTISSIRMMASKEITEEQLMADCIESIYTKEDVFTPDTTNEAVEFIEQMSTPQYEKFTKFFETMPKLKHELTYTCSGCGEVETVTFEGVADFF